MKLFLKSRVIEGAAIAAALYIPVWLLLSRQVAFTLISAITLSLWIGILVSYARGMWYAVRDPSQSLSTRISLTGITGLGLSITALFAWSVLYQYLNQPAWLRLHPARNFINWMFMCSTAAIWAAVAMVGDRGFLPEGAIRKPAAMVALGTFLVLTILALIGGQF